MQGRLDSLPAEVRPCMGCHLNPGLALSYRDSTGHLHQASIDLAAYEASIHFHSGERACGDCHTGDYSRVPHPADNPQPTCLSCHDDYRQEYASIDAMAHRSVHYAPDAPMDFDCGTCHSPHSMRPARELTVADRNAACIDCHEHRYNPSGLTLAQRHAWHPQAALHLDRIACIDCHTQPAGAGYAFRHDILPKEQATSDCYACHGANTKMTAYMGSYEGGRPQPYTRGQLLEDYYISGGTRSPLLDRLGLLFMLLVALGTGLHGLLRWCANRRGWCAFMQIGSETP
ncbi:MAG TPA: cytochrome c3 family protein [Longimicrobiales bacterium]|nr:cytochrome c3 family protein [Longimicrobiales bacterium]